MNLAYISRSIQVDLRGGIVAQPYDYKEGFFMSIWIVFRTPKVFVFRIRHIYLDFGLFPGLRTPSQERRGN